MSDNTRIEWTDATWNPVTGCTKVSPGCDHCYAETIAHRFAGTKAFPNGFAVTLHPERLDQPLRWRKPRRVFVNSMSDLFHDDIPDDFIASVFAVMALAEQHTFQVLTKRHGRMRSLLCNRDFQVAIALQSLQFDDAILGMPWPLRNVWLGVSVEDQKRADLRIPALLETPAAVRWISAEPLLGPVRLDAALGGRQWGCGGQHHGTGGPGCPRHLDHHHDGRCKHPIDWVVCGGESGPGARPMHPDWARSLRDQCTAAGVPFFFKQWGEYRPAVTASYLDIQDPLGGRGQGCVVELDGQQSAGWEMGGRSGFDGRVTPQGWPMLRVGKKAAGRELDGRTWDEYPAGAR